MAKSSTKKTDPTDDALSAVEDALKIDFAENGDDGSEAVAEGAEQFERQLSPYSPASRFSLPRRPVVAKVG